MLDKVRLLDDPVLRITCEEVPAGFIGLQPILSRMYATMLEERGIGLAANQIGFSYRIFILKTETLFDAFINPEVLEASELTEFENEACLSLPGAFATTKRFNKLKLRWQDAQGTKIEGEFSSMMAQAVQHEMDHLNGKLYVDQFGPLKRQMVVAKHKKFLRLSRRK